MNPGGKALVLGGIVIHRENQISSCMSETPSVLYDCCFSLQFFSTKQHLFHFFPLNSLRSEAVKKIASIQAPI